MEKKISYLVVKAGPHLKLMFWNGLEYTFKKFITKNELVSLKARAKLGYIELCDMSEGQ